MAPRPILAIGAHAARVGHTVDVFSAAVAQAVSERLSLAGCVAADDETKALLAAAPDAQALDGWVTRRERGEPLAWILGRVVFCGHVVHVEPGVYVPRFQSEELAVRAASTLPSHGRAADLCTGAGAVAIHLMEAQPRAAVVATDLDRVAVRCARRNGVRAIVADLDRGFRSDAFDVVTAVTPYVPTSQLRLLPADVQRYEPPLALDGGLDGLALVRRLVYGAGRMLHVGGWLLTEVGGGQDQALGPVFAACGFETPTPWFDEDGDLRGVMARLVTKPT